VLFDFVARIHLSAAIITDRPPNSTDTRKETWFWPADVLVELSFVACCFAWCANMVSWLSPSQSSTRCWRAKAERRFGACWGPLHHMVPCYCQTDRLSWAASEHPPLQSQGSYSSNLPLHCLSYQPHQVVEEAPCYVCSCLTGFAATETGCTCCRNHVSNTCQTCWYRSRTLYSAQYCDLGRLLKSLAQGLFYLN